MHSDCAAAAAGTPIVDEHMARYLEEAATHLLCAIEAGDVDDDARRRGEVEQADAVLLFVGAMLEEHSASAQPMATTLREYCHGARFVMSQIDPYADQLRYAAVAASLDRMALHLRRVSAERRREADVIIPCGFEMTNAAVAYLN